MHRLTDKEVSLQLSVALTLALSQHGDSLRSKSPIVRTMAHDAIVLRLVTAISSESACVVNTDLRGCHATQRAGRFGVDEPWPAELILELGEDHQDEIQLALFANG